MGPRTLFVAVLVLCVNARFAQATTISFNTGQSVFAGSNLNQGWWSATRVNSDSNANIFTGLAHNGALVDDLHSFFTFDLSSLNLAGQIVASATLTVTNSGFYQSGNASETLGLFDVSTAAAALNANNGTSAAIFADLGTGTSYGSFVVPSYVTDTPQSFSLNNAGLAAIASGAGGFFSIGGALTSLNNNFNGSGFEGIFVGTEVPPGPFVPVTLTLDVEPVATAVPEPASVSLPAVGLAGLYRRRSRRSN